MRFTVEKDGGEVQKDPEGRWRLARDIFNSDQPVATGD